MEDATIQLAYPVQAEGRELTQLRLRRPKVRDELAAQRPGGSDAERELRLLANLCEVAPATLEDLDMADYLRLQEAYKGFFDLERKPPAKPS